MTPEELLHHLAPYLPTDRFRALLAGQELPEYTQGAAMLVDISGFTPLTVQLVEDYGPQRASEELKRRLNPMFEAIGGLVFTHGGSVIRFVGDGFTAWFPDEEAHFHTLENPMSGLMRAVIAGVEMLETMVFFRGLDLKVAIMGGSARRWVVGAAEQGSLDTLVGPAVEGVSELAARCQRHQTRAGGQHHDILAAQGGIQFEVLPDGDLLLQKVDSELVERSRRHRWPAWQASGNLETILSHVRQFVDPVIQEQETHGLSNLSGDLRYATPIFMNFKGIDYNHDANAREKLDLYVRDVQKILSDTAGRLVSLEVADKGSVIFAVFGAPVAYGDDSRRAIHAALSFKRLPQKHPFITGQQIGISRGLLYSGTFGGEVRHEYTSLGDETIIASRLMSADKNGEILVSAAAYDDSNDWFEFQQGETITPKGRIGLVDTYIPLSTKSRIKRDLRKLPMVGRNQEQAHLTQALEIISKGRAVILRVEGEAGIGKSRFAAEIIHEAQNKGYTVANSFCASTGRSEAFSAWKPLLRSLLEIEEGWSDSRQIGHITNWLAVRNEDWLILLPLLTSDLLDLPTEDTPTTRNLTGSARQQALFSLVVDLLYYEAAIAPLVLVIEDTQWLDEVSEALITELATRLAASPASLLLSLLHRPIESPTPLIQTIHELFIHRFFQLTELPEKALGELLTHQLGGIVPPELTHYVHERSQGNPFFAQEITDALKDNNLIKRIGPRVYIEDHLEKVNLPQTVQGLIQARLDNLTEAEKLILKIGAVIGRQFEIRVLYQSLPLEIDPETVMERLRTLERALFIQLESLYPEPIYAFRHAITQEVTYQTLLYDQRKQWHHSVGAILETLQPQAWERLAYHFAQTDDSGRAYLYLVRAGDKSAREFANHAALSYWGRALTFNKSPKEQFDLHCKRLELLIRTANLQEAQNTLDKIIQLSEDAPHNLNWKLRRFRYQAEHALNLGELQQAREYSDDGVALSERYQDSQVAWELYSIQTRVYGLLWQPEKQAQASQRLRQIAEELNEPAKGLRLILNDLQDLAHDAPETALEALETTYPKITELADPILEGNYWDIVSEITLTNRMLIPAEAALRTQLRIWRQIGNRRREGIALNQLGRVLYFLGQYTTAGAQFRDSYTVASQVNDRWNEADSLVQLGALSFRRGSYGEAAAYISRGMVSLQENGAQVALGRAQYFQGMIALAQHHHNDALTALNHAHDTLTQAGKTDELPEIAIAIAFTKAHAFTLPLPASFNQPIYAMLERLPRGVHDPDLACWYAHHLLSIFELEMAPLSEAFSRYVRGQLATFSQPEQREAFLNIGHTTNLLHLLDIPLD